MQINLAIVDDKYVNRKSIADQLGRFPAFNILFEASNGIDFYEKLIKLENNVLDLVIIDLDMPKMNGIDTIQMCKFKYPNLKFIVLTIFEDIDKIFEAICAGAHGYLLKEDIGLNLETAIKNAYEFNAMPMSPTIARKSMDLIKLSSTKELKESELSLHTIITEREIDILKQLTTGMSYPKIGEVLFISPLTVKKHVANIYEKLHVNSRSQLIMKAKELKWI